MTQTQFRQELRTGLSGAYLLYGDEDYLKKFYSERAKTTVAGDDSDFSEWNSFNIGQKDTGDPDIASLEEAVYSVPMMGGRVFVKYSVNITSLKEEENEQLLSVLGQVKPERTVVLVICPPQGFDPGSKNRQSSAFKAYSRVAQLVELCAETPGELKKWMERRLSRDKLTLAPGAADAIIARSGSSMFTLSGELDKLAAYALANSIESLDATIINEITSVTEQDSAFALANAILDGDRRRALSVLHIHKNQRDAALMVAASVTRSICEMMTVSCLMADGADKTTISAKMKMHEYRVGLYMNAVRGSEPERLIAAANRCREADIKLKTTRLDYIALERLICTIPAKRRSVR